MFDMLTMHSTVPTTLTPIDVSITNRINSSILGLRSLDVLVLAHNQLREVPARVFGHLKLLTSLELEGNKISHIDIDAFSGLEGMLKKRGRSGRGDRLNLLLVFWEEFGFVLYKGETVKKVSIGNEKEEGK